MDQFMKGINRINSISSINSIDEIEICTIYDSPEPESFIPYDPTNQEVFHQFILNSTDYEQRQLDLPLLPKTLKEAFSRDSDGHKWLLAYHKEWNALNDNGCFKEVKEIPSDRKAFKDGCSLQNIKRS
jgi:hypothetical protein